METLKRFLADNWRSKLVSLLIAVSVWYLIKSHLVSGNTGFPVPGTGTETPARPATGPVLDETLLGPLVPPPIPVPIPATPVPGGAVKG